MRGNPELFMFIFKAVLILTKIGFLPLSYILIVLSQAGKCYSSRHLALPASLSSSGSVQWCRWWCTHARGPCAACQKDKGTWKARKTWALISRKEWQKNDNEYLLSIHGETCMHIIFWHFTQDNNLTFLKVFFLKNHSYKVNWQKCLIPKFKALA